MGMSGFLRGPATTGELRCALEGSGVPCADQDGTTTMPPWCADSSDTPHQALVSYGHANNSLFLNK